MRKLTLSMLLSAGAATGFSQQSIVISAGGGINTTSSTVKSNSYLGNGYNLQGEVFIPFLRKGWDGSVKGGSRFALGIIAGGKYYTSKSMAPDAASLRNEYKLYNGELDITNVPNEAPAKGFTGSLGLQADFSFGPIVISPSVSGGYFSLRQSGFSQTASVAQNDGTRQTFTLTNQPSTKRTGFVTIPQLKISYPVTEAFYVYTSAGFNMGPKMDNEQTMLKPAGGFNDKNTYEPAQLSAGKMVLTSAGSVRYQSMMVNIGISWGLGRKVKNSSTMPLRLSMTPTTTRQTQGNTFGEKVNQGLQPAAIEGNPLYNGNGTETTNPMSELARPGTPIGGIVVKGGKNPGGNMITTTSNENGEIELNGLEAGTYQFTLSPPDAPQEKSISEKGVRASRKTSYARTGRTYTGGRKNEPQGKSISEKGLKRSDAQEMARPGSPIGGIVVKGGKNPGGNMINLTVDEGGNIQFEVLEPGDYKFIIQSPENNPPSEKEKVKERPSSGLKDTLKTNV